ncbi:MAG: YebC/PmpR family DNA-binding transcriptional regulator [Bacteroidales bacterium]|nr:YebC/PmpR family DNA-binding transcriptional regulator [Bacteroidales bacterium]MBO7142844.1 YebC/PmpR family DNA-binding transcriptional regulator [Bacteroidales bacterium]
MSGHNKWSTIKRKKGALDAKRSAMFSRIAKEIAVAVKEGGPDPDGNPRLRTAIQNAKGVSMPKDNIERAISKSAGEGVNYQEITFEGYAPGGVAVFIECLTDNNNRTVASIRSIFNKRNGSLGTNGSLSFLFDRKGVFTIPVNGKDPDELEMELIEAGADDIERETNEDDETIFTVYTSMEGFVAFQKKLDELGIEATNASLQRIPNNMKELSTAEGVSVLKMIEAFEDDDDVQNVFHNLEVTEEMEAQME